MPDELRYAELAKAIAESGLPRIREEVTLEFGIGYPLLLAPIWAIFSDISDAYVTAKILNAVVLSLTAVPAFFLARRFLDETRSIVVAALTVCVPSLLYAGILMTEVALYPLYVLALLAIAVALERPSSSTQAAALGAIALASLVKILAVSLLAGYVIAVLLHSWLKARSGSQWRQELRCYGFTWAALATISLVALVGAVVVRVDPLVVFGAYRGAIGHADVLEIPTWALVHMATFDLYVAVIPFAATLLAVVAGSRRDASSRMRLFASQTAAVSVSLFGAVAVYSADSRVPEFGYVSGASSNERSTFFLAPLAFVALMAILRDRRHHAAAIVVVALLAAVLPAAIPLDRFREEGNVAIQAFSLVPWAGSRGSSVWPLGVLVLTFALGLLLVVALRGALRDVFVVAAVAGALIAVTLIAQETLVLSSRGSGSVALGRAPGWIDAVAGNERVSILWYEPAGRAFVLDPARHRVLWINEFFNRRLGKVYELGSHVAFGSELPSTPVRIDDGVLVLEDGASAPLGPLIFAPCQVRIDGEVVARDARTGAAVYRVLGDVRVEVIDPADCRPA